MNDGTVQAPLIAQDHRFDGKYHLLLAASGSVATIKIPNIVRAFEDFRSLSIRIVLTSSAAQFLQGQSHEQPTLQEILGYANVDAIYLDRDEWTIPWIRGAPILHIELRRWADSMVIAPLSANTLAKIANGICDNLLTSVVRAWQVEDGSDTENPSIIDKQKYITVAPAMNTAMWRHPLTSLQLYGSLEVPHGQESQNVVTQKGLPHWFLVLRPIEKTLACGDSGDGAMHDWQGIVTAIKTRIAQQGVIRHLASM